MKVMKKTETECTLIREMWRVRKEHRNSKHKKDSLFGEMFYRFRFQLWCFRNIYDRNEKRWNKRMTV